MKNGKKLKLGDAHVTPRNIQQVQASKIGDANASPLHQQKYQVISQCAIFLLLHILCVILGASLFLFAVFFIFIFVLFAVINGWTPSFLVLEETHSVLIAQNTLVFTFIVPRVFQFAYTSFSSCFSCLFVFTDCLVFFIQLGLAL